MGTEVSLFATSESTLVNVTLRDVTLIFAVLEGSSSGIALIARNVVSHNVSVTRFCLLVAFSPNVTPRTSIRPSYS